MKPVVIALIALLFFSPSEAKTAPALRRSVSSIANTKAKKLNPAKNPLPQTQLDTILPFAEFTKLSKENQEFYILELQRLVLEIQKHDDQLKTAHQTAQ